MPWTLARRAARMHPSTIRELLKIATAVAALGAVLQAAMSAAPVTAGQPDVLTS